MSPGSFALDPLLAELDADGHPSSPADRADGQPIDPGAQLRLRAMVDLHHAFLWRSLRRLGVPEPEVDDAAQQAWLVVSRKLALISQGAEKAFIFSVALRVAAAHRRSTARRSEIAGPDAQLEDPAPRADELLERHRARALVDRILDEMPLEVRAVFVLYEVEEMTAPEISQLLGIPLGTVASRLRRGRAMFEERLARHQARAARGGSR